MKSMTLQAILEVPMSYRQAQAATAALPPCCREFGLKRAALSGYCVLRGLTLIELQLKLGDTAEPHPAAQATLAHFIVSAEGLARGGESDEFVLVFAEVFPTGRNYEPEPVLLPADLGALGIGGTDQREDDSWAEVLSRYYNPAARQPSEVRFKQVRLRP